MGETGLPTVTYPYGEMALAGPGTDPAAATVPGKRCTPGDYCPEPPNRRVFVRARSPAASATCDVTSCAVRHVRRDPPPPLHPLR